MFVKNEKKVNSFSQDNPQLSNINFDSFVLILHSFYDNNSIASLELRVKISEKVLTYSFENAVRFLLMHIHM